jgi:HTH-type transcriptional regulator / antitoxin HipB
VVATALRGYVAVRIQIELRTYGNKCYCCRTTSGGGMFTVREAAAVVRELRSKRRWTQAELAAQASVSRSFVVDVEAGKPTVESAKLFDIFQALGFEIALRDIDKGEVRW